MNEENSEIVLIDRDDYRRINDPRREMRPVKVYRPKVSVQLARTPRN